PAAPTSSAKPSSSSRRSRMRSGSSSQPSHCASSLPVQTVGSRSQIRSTTFVATVIGRSERRSRRSENVPLVADALFQLDEGAGELLHALALEHVRHVVVVDADVAKLREQLARL